MEITNVPSSGSPLTSGAQAALGSTSGGLFPRILEHALTQSAQLNQQSQSAIMDLASGKNDNFHDVVLQVAKNDLNFRLMLQMRNQLTNAYQELMKMTVG